MSSYLPTIIDHRAGPQVIQAHTKSYFNTSTYGSIQTYTGEYDSTIEDILKLDHSLRYFVLGGHKLQ